MDGCATCLKPSRAGCVRLSPLVAIQRTRVGYGFLSLAAILFVAALPSSAEEVQGPPPPASVEGLPPDEREPKTVSPQEAQSKQAPGAEPVLKALPAESGYTVIPLPSISYNRNERYWIGTLTSLLKANAKGDIEDIWAPQYLYNPIVGHGGTLSYYSYPSDTVQYHAMAWYSQKVDRGVEFGYKDLGAGAGRYILAADFAAFKNPFARFFGFGSRAPAYQETAYTSRELQIKLTAGINLTPDFSFMLTERYRNVRIDDNIIPSLPSTKQLFETIPGIEGAQVLGHGLTLRYDTRDSQLMPTKGTYVNALAEFAHNLKTDEENQWGHVTLDARRLFPHGGDKVFLARLFFNGVFGHIERKGTTLGVPFYEQPTLGGEDTLRAFGRNRYTGTWAVLANIEERVPVLSKRFFDHAIEIEVAPFLDVGRVGQTGVSAGHLLFRDIQVNPGAGFRLLAKPNVVGRLDIGYGRDGANVFVGLDYPF